ncbi:hypothetical protein J7E91_33940 [Streptomyces sp. ISL-99]|uniref:hypothetical protein n=1 Tax=Streptomyces sp. ISL-99 TaxID=2819193 RepID=UPI001BE9B989|nr:hypothetical protein [Streptomyces sp. ISL-99]MBT2530223.1 hypothetical protein [Streptomyces sp. ISL-99]
MRLEAAPGDSNDSIGSQPSAEPNRMSADTARSALSLLRTEGGRRLPSVVVREKRRRTTR